jgi:peptide/nickel transport system permease protein
VQRYIIRRVFQAIFTLLALSLAVFLAVHSTGDPALYLIGVEGEGEKEHYEALKKEMGLDKPIMVQYGHFLSRVIRADFGKSTINQKPARESLFERFPATVQLAAAAFALEVIVGVALGILSAVKRDSLIDLFGKFFAVIGIATPNFWVAIMLILLFGAILGWLPTFGRGGPEHLILPAFVLGTAGMAGMTRLVRSSMLDVLDSEYVKFARVKGLPERLVIYKHALKNAAIPALTFGGLSLAGLLNGSVVIEVVFAWPGIGRLLLEGIQRRDFPVVEAAVLAAGTLYIVSALVVDILYVYINPRIRYG